MSQMIRDDQSCETMWKYDLAEMVTLSLNAGTADELVVLRKVYDLLVSAPAPSSALVDGLPGLDKFESMLASGAPESAALSLIPAPAGYMLSRGSNGRHMGSVFIPGSREEHTVEAGTAALALLAAVLSALSHQTHDQRSRADLLN